MRIILSIAFVLCLTCAAYPATYKGKNIDGKKYKAVVSNSDGEYSSVDIRFEGRAAYIYYEKWTHKVFLEKSAIDDPRNIPARDGVHVWKLEIWEKLD